MKMPRALYLLFISPLCFAQSALGVPSFADYPVAQQRLGPPHKIVLQGARDRRYASVLREASARQPDFAGRYILASWGCGAGCVMAAAIDAGNGRVVWLPFTVCCWPLEITEPLEYKPDSRLLIVHGRRDEKGLGGVHSYLIDSVKGRFVAVAGDAR